MRILYTSEYKKLSTKIPQGTFTSEHATKQNKTRRIKIETVSNNVSQDIFGNTASTKLANNLQVIYIANRDN